MGDMRFCDWVYLVLYALNLIGVGLFAWMTFSVIRGRRTRLMKFVRRHETTLLFMTLAIMFIGRLLLQCEAFWLVLFFSLTVMLTASIGKDLDINELLDACEKLIDIGNRKEVGDDNE